MHAVLHLDDDRVIIFRRHRVHITDDAEELVLGTAARRQRALLFAPVARVLLLVDGLLLIRTEQPLHGARVTRARGAPFINGGERRVASSSTQAQGRPPNRVRRTLHRGPRARAAPSESGPSPPSTNHPVRGFRSIKRRSAPRPSDACARPGYASALLCAARRSEGDSSRPARPRPRRRTRRRVFRRRRASSHPKRPYRRRLYKNATRGAFHQPPRRGPWPFHGVERAPPNAVPKRV